MAGIVPIMVVYFLVYSYFRKSFIELQRIDSVTRSPIYAFFTEALSGIETIRSYVWEDQYSTTQAQNVDFNHKCYMALKVADEWLSLRLDLLGFCIVVLTAVLAIV